MLSSKTCMETKHNESTFRSNHPLKNLTYLIQRSRKMLVLWMCRCKVFNKCLQVRTIFTIRHSRWILIIRPTWLAHLWDTWIKINLCLRGSMVTTTCKTNKECLNSNNTNSKINNKEGFLRDILTLTTNMIPLQGCLIQTKWCNLPIW